MSIGAEEEEEGAEEAESKDEETPPSIEEAECDLAVCFRR